MHHDKGVPIMLKSNFYELFRAGIRGCLTPVRKLASPASRVLRSFPAFYAAIFLMAGYALWEARTPVTIIEPFQVPKADLPFSGELVADALQDSLKSIRNDIEAENFSLRSSETGLPNLRNMVIPKLRRVQAPPRFAVEVKGVSYERILSIARAIRGTETTVSGDVFLKANQFILVARAADAGPWESIPSPIGGDGLKQASKDLAMKILMTQDPTLLGVALLEEGQGEQALAALDRARSLDPTDARIKLNLCMGFAANRRYEEAIGCYKDVLTTNPKSSSDVWEPLAQAYYLQGKRKEARDLYRRLAYKQGDREALLGLGEVLDDDNESQAALNVYDDFLAAEREDRNRAIAHVKRGLALAHLGRHDEALNEYQEALKYAPRDILVLVHKALELAAAAGPDAGIAELQSVVNENENSDSAPFAFLQLGILLENNGDWPAAIRQYRLAARRHNYVEAHQRLAHALVHEGHTSEALEEYKVIAQLSDSDLQRGYYQIFANQWLGNDLRDSGNYSAAASAYREAIRLKPDYGAAHCELGLILAKQGRLSQAVHEYGAALVPAKVKDLDDSDCTVMAQRELLKVFASEASEKAASRTAGLSKPRREIVNLQPTADNTVRLGLARDKRLLVDQAVLEMAAH
jgi:tetratricopeptide (TPR) repeat protein